MRRVESCATMECVELTIALTLLFSFGSFLFFPTVDAPPIFSRVAITLCAAEFVAVVFWAAGDECIVAGCAEAAQTARTAASVDIPVLTALMLVLATAYGLRVARTWYQFRDADPRHGRARESRGSNDPRPDRSRA
jgi:hypothetical protein